jgi:hypothetical protein
MMSTSKNSPIPKNTAKNREAKTLPTTPAGFEERLWNVNFILRRHFGGAGHRLQAKYVRDCLFGRYCHVSKGAQLEVLGRQLEDGNTCRLGFPSRAWGEGRSRRAPQTTGMRALQSGRCPKV